MSPGGGDTEDAGCSTIALSGAATRLTAECWLQPIGSP